MEYIAFCETCMAEVPDSAAANGSWTEGAARDHIKGQNPVATRHSVIVGFRVATPEFDEVIATRMSDLMTRGIDNP